MNHQSHASTLAAEPHSTISHLTCRATRLWAVAFSIVVLAGAVPAQAVIPVPTNCQNDVDGANDQPGQKDVTRYCTDVGDGSPYEILSISNWDNTTLTGNNTADICTLYDTDNDGLANLAVCVTLQTSGAGNGNLAILQTVRLVTCSDTRADRCTGSTLVAGPYTTTCEVSQQSTDPFSPASLNGPGDQFPTDTQILCGIDLGDFGPSGTGAKLLDSCSYPSTIPNSDPSDCVAYAVCTTAGDCDDANSCTIDACSAGVCTHAPNTGQACSDGLYCNGDEICNNLGFCEPDTARDCDDGVACTVDSCDELTDSCINDPRNSLCSDDQYCNGAEVCNPLVGCEAGVPPDCNDGVTCTTDSCNEGTDSCVNTPSNAACDDGQHCNGAETCDAQNGCVGGAAPVCDDGIVCTLDSCNESTNSCDFTPNDAACSDGQYCNGTETCDPLNGCENGPAPDCDDGVSCTTDACDELNDQCTHLPDNGDCSDGQFCTGVEICDVVNGCQPGSDPCPGPSTCSETLDQCVGCTTNAQCDNGVYCDGAETCNVGTGACLPGTPPSCNDGVACTLDSCNEATNTCDNVASDALCDNGDYCDGAETCSPLAGCQNGTAPSCGDGVACTVDACNETTDSCDNTPSDAACDDGLFCDGVETCDAVNDCQAGNPVQCADGFACSINSCDEATDACDADFTTCFCGDGEVTGTEQCDPPATAGTFEDCNNLVDDDGDGDVDCTDADCDPGSRPAVCDESCTQDLVCAKVKDDPAVIIYNWDGGHDFLSIHGRFELLDGLDPMTQGVVFEISNEQGAIYRAFVDPGQLVPNSKQNRYSFRDKTAKLLGQAGIGDGIYKIGLIRRDFDGVPYVTFRIRAYGDFKFATKVTMTTQLSVGTATGSLTAGWTPMSRGWKLPLSEF